MVRILLETGANVNGLNNYENEHLLSPLQWTAFNGNLTRFKLLMHDVNTNRINFSIFTQRT